MVRTLRPVALAAACAAALAACSTVPESATAPSGTVGMQSDFLVYDEQSLVEDATLVAEGTAIASESTLLMPRLEGDTPEENPVLDLSEDEKKDAVANASGVPVTVVTFRVDTVHKGAPSPGEDITIIQTGGVVDGVDYVLASEIPLEVQQRYLLFAGDDVDGAFSILGGSGGTYTDAGDGTYVAASPDMAPFDTLTTAEVVALTS